MKNVAFDAYRQRFSKVAFWHVFWQRIFKQRLENVLFNKKEQTYKALLYHLHIDNVYLKDSLHFMSVTF